MAVTLNGVRFIQRTVPFVSNCAKPLEMTKNGENIWLVNESAPSRKGEVGVVKATVGRFAESTTTLHALPRLLFVGSERLELHTTAPFASNFARNGPEPEALELV